MWKINECYCMLLVECESVEMREALDEMRWEILCCPKEERWIRFRLIHEFNLAILAKKLWKLIQFPDSLFARVFKGKYHHTCLIFWTTGYESPSYISTSLIEVKPLLLFAIRHIVYLRYQIHVWDDLWIPANPARPAILVSTNDGVWFHSWYTKSVECWDATTICGSGGYSFYSDLGHKLI